MDYGVAPAGRKAVALWLYVIAAMVLSMVILGGLTRLTGSGLSMTDWKPILGAVPPLGEGDWLARFEQYKQFPEYKLLNHQMTLPEFKFIFAMEFSHRLLGRAVGVVFFFPFVYFLIRKWLGKPMILRGVLLFTLGGMQGFMGWYMVASGLVDEPRVSQYRLTAHLSLALLIYCLAFWFATRLRYADKPAQMGARPRLGQLVMILVLVVVQITSGGFVAGLDAGLAFNTFPTMNGQWVPAGLWSMEPLWRNVFDNPVTVQFLHRCSAYVVSLAVLWVFFSNRVRVAGTALQTPLLLLPILLAVQVGLGIATLLMRVPVALGSLHQLGAVALLTLILFLLQRTLAVARPA